MSKPVWSIKLYGVRGSTPVCDPAFQTFGGNTTALRVDLLDGGLGDLALVIDAGSGIRQLGRDLMAATAPDAAKHVLLLFTHFHWDHIQGLPFFDPAYDPDRRISIFSPHDSMGAHELREILATQMLSTYFPVPLEKMGAKFGFYTLAESRETLLTVGEAITFDCLLHNHPGGAYSYRMEAGGRSFVLCTDLEHGEELDPAVVEFCRGADLLIHDAQYTTAELETHRGWGHSSYEQAVETARRAGVGELVFVHHDPDHDDAFLAREERRLQAVFPNCRMGREGMEIRV